MSEEKTIKEMDKLINRFIFQSRKFVDYAAFLYGLNDFLSIGEKSTKFTYDFEYFAFTKSTKTLMSIRKLLKSNYNEDAIILIRSIFENYLACRYFNENQEKIDDFIFNPINIALAHYNVQGDGTVINRNKEEVGRQSNPSSFKIGRDKSYYFDFYDFLSHFAHCNFGILNCFIDNNGHFSLYEKNYPLLTRFFTLFTFSRLFEHVVTVEGEDFIDIRTEKECYKLVLDSNSFLADVIETLKQEFISDDDETLKYRNKRIRNMLKNMKKALKEELGSIPK